MSSSSSAILWTSCDGTTTRACVVFPPPNQPLAGVAWATTGGGNAVNQRFRVDMSQRPVRVERVEGPSGPTPLPPDCSEAG